MKHSTNLIDNIHQRLQQKLPGLDAQMAMAPSVRERDWVIPENARKSGVLVLLYPHESEFHIAFMKRTDDGRVHGGQVCFPGGGVEKEDRDFIHTALREAEEEMGIPQDQLKVLGSLTNLYIPPSNSLVFPTVGYMVSKPVFKPDPVEVAKIIEVPLKQLMDTNIIGTHRVDVFNGNFIHAPGYTVNGEHLIWGATAMMIAEFVSIIDEIKDKIY